MWRCAGGVAHCTCALIPSLPPCPSRVLVGTQNLDCTVVVMRSCVLGSIITWAKNTAFMTSLSQGGREQWAGAMGQGQSARGRGKGTGDRDYWMQAQQARVSQLPLDLAPHLGSGAICVLDRPHNQLDKHAASVTPPPALFIYHTTHAQISQQLMQVWVVYRAWQELVGGGSGVGAQLVGAAWAVSTGSK